MLSVTVGSSDSLFKANKAIIPLLPRASSAIQVIDEPLGVVLISTPGYLLLITVGANKRSSTKNIS